MTDYSSRFRVNIGQLQMLLAILYDTLAPQLPRSCHERVEEILADPGGGDEKALLPQYKRGPCGFGLLRPDGGCKQPFGHEGPCDGEPQESAWVFFCQGHDGAGWYYADHDYYDEGSVGAFGSREEAEAHAREADYEGFELSERWHDAKLLQSLNQPAGEAQPEGRCARCGGDGECVNFLTSYTCPDCKGTGRVRVGEATRCKDCGRPKWSPSMGPHNSSEETCAAEYWREEGDGVRNDCLLRANSRLERENASLRERLEAAERLLANARAESKYLAEVDAEGRRQKERVEKAEQESSLQRDRAKRAELRLEQAERECAELKQMLSEEGHRGMSAEMALSEALGMTTFESDGSVSDTGEWSAMLARVRGLTEKLATYEREAKAIDDWVSGNPEYRQIHITVREGQSFAKAVSEHAAWCESQLKKESE